MSGKQSGWSVNNEISDYIQVPPLWRDLRRRMYRQSKRCYAAKQEEDSSIVAAITKLKNEQWSTEDIVALLLGQTKKEYMKLFSDDTDKMPVHGGAFEIPAVMADNTKND